MSKRLATIFVLFGLGLVLTGSIGFLSLFFPLNAAIVGTLSIAAVVVGILVLLGVGADKQGV